MPKRIGKKGIVAILLALITVIGVASLAFFTDRASHSMQFTTAKFSAEGYTLTRTAPVGPFCADEDVTATLKESYTGEDDANSIISMKATWVSPDTSLSIFGNANDADNAKLSVGGTNISYKVSSDNRSVTFDLPKHALAKGSSGASRELTLHIPASFKSTGRIDFTFEKVVVGMDGAGFTKEFSRTDLNAADKLDYSVKVGWAASSIANQNGKALMGYLTDKNSSGKYGIEFEFAFNYNTSPMKDFASKTDAKWSYYKDKADRLTFVEGMTSIGDYAFPDFELVTSLTLPESLMSVGKWAFDNVSIPTLTLPAALTSFDSMSFGHINELTVITFEQAKNTSISFPTAGSTTGAFYVDPYVPTQIVGENPIAQGYDWITDQRRVAPVIRSYNYTWSGDRMSQPLDATTLTPDDNSNVDFHTAENRAKIKSVVFQDANGYYAIPNMKPADAGGLVEANSNMWDVSAAGDKSVIAWLKDDGTLIIAADGVKVMANADSDWLFGDMENIETIDATLYDTSNATTMEYWHAFAEPDLKQGDGDWSGDPLPMEVPKKGAKQIVGIQDWNVSKVTSTRDMFYNANRLTSLNLGNWNTKSLKTPNGMFHGSSALATLNVSGWDTSNVTTLQSIFAHCKALTALDVSGWDVRKVADMSFAFSDCGAPVLDLHTWKTSSLNTLEKTFAGAAAKTINVTGWDTSKVTTMDSTFENTTNVQALNLSTWDTSAVGRGTEIDDEGNEVTYGTEAFNNMFFRSGAKSINVSGFDFGSFYGKGNWSGGLYNMFRECKNLTEIVGAETWTNTGKILQLYNTFMDCEKLVTLNVSTWDTSGVTSMANAFSGCKALAALDVSKWNVSSCETYINTFKDCASVKVLDISKWDMTKATASASQNMFNGCKSLKSLTFPKAVNWLATSMAANCPKLTTIEFLSTDDSIIQRPLAGEKLGAFYVAPDAGVTVPVVTRVITHGTGMAQLKNSSTYNWADDNRCMAEVNCPKQSGSLTYNGSSQSPSWSGYDSTKMTIGGTTSGTNAGSYTATFTPKDGYCWPDGTTDTVSVTWMIDKAPGSLTLSKTEAEIGEDQTTTTFTVTRAGNGKISVTSSNSSIATASVNGTTVTVTKKGGGTATITVKVAEGTNYLAPADAACKVTCTVEPVLAASNTWYKSSQNRNTITKITLMDKYTPTTAADESWDASAKGDKSVMAYRTGTEIIIAGNGCGKIYANADSSWMFQGSGAGGYSGERDGFRNLETIEGIELLDTSKVTDMGGMFAGCSSLTSLDVTKFDTSKVTDMSSMFWGCRSLANLDVSNFDTSYVTDMNSMFKGNSYWGSDTMALTSLDVTKFDTSNVTDMSDMFNGCSGLTSLDVTKFDTSKVTDMSSMFNGCSSLTSLDVSKFDTSKVTDMRSMFYNCAKLASLDVTKFDTSKVTNMDGMFWGCSGLTSLDVTKFDTSKVTDMRSMFQGCSGLTSLDVTKFDTSNVTNMYGMFYGCSGLTSLDLSSFNTAKVADMRCMFGGGIRGGEYIDGWCTNLREVVLGKDFRFVPDGNYPYYLPAPSSTYISGATGNWYVKGLGNTPCYTPAELAAVNRVRAVTYTAIPSTETGGGGSAGSEFDVNYPKQSGSLTYNGNAQSPSWSGYDSTKMTIGGTTSGTNAGSYTATFKPKDGYCWPDGTADTVSVTWKIGKATVSVPSQSGTLTYNGSAQSPAWSEYDSTKLTLGGTKSGTNAGTYTAKFTPTANYQWADGTTAAKNVTWSIGKAAGSLSISKTSITIDAISETGSFTVTRAGDGAISVSSNAPSVATASISGTTVTVTKKGAGSATITVSVAEGTNYTAPADKFCTAACKVAPVLAEGSTWYKSSTNRNTISKITLMDSYSATGNETESWDASAAQDGSVMAYRTGTEIIIAGNGAGKIYANERSYAVFLDFSSLTTISGMEILDIGQVTDMGAMFMNCKALTSLDLSGWNTSNVTDMGSMFGNCGALTSLDLSGWNTSNVTDMNSMFGDCGALTSLDLSGWNTSNVTDMGWMFQGCNALISVGDLSGWDTSNVTNMRAMFMHCKALASLDLSGWNTSNVTNMKDMFADCGALTSLDLSHFNTSKVTDLGEMFQDCNALISVGDLSGWNTSNVTNMKSMFNDCGALTSLDLSGWNTSKVTDMGSMFLSCKALTSLDLSGWNTSNVMNMQYMFNGCGALQKIYASDLWSTASITDISGKGGAMFTGCRKLSGAISYRLDKTSCTYANYTTGYLTYKAAP